MNYFVEHAVAVQVGERPFTYNWFLILIMLMAWMEPYDYQGMEVVIADFTTHGVSHFYFLPCPSADSLDPMDHFCTFDVSNIIPKNMKKLPYATFNPFLTYIGGFDP